ncbi:MAG: hypothetical protein HY892_16475 [Deltaproteobacteria bacterium]|nr:hypothetical protein [Deltaproteobacteria bacterium]
MKNQQKQKSIRTSLAVVLVLIGLGLTSSGTGWAQAPPIFLPLVMREAVGPGPGPVPTFLQNGGFESGPLAWIEASVQNLLPLTNQTDPVAIPAHSGQWGAWLCGTVNEISKVSQQFVLVPAGTPFLTFWVWIDSLAPCGLHTGMVLVNGLPVDTFNLCTATNTGGWVKRAVNLTALSGSGINLEFQGNCNTPNETISNLFLDDVVFAAAAN